MSRSKVAKLVVWSLIVVALGAGTLWFFRRNRNGDATRYQSAVVDRGDIVMKVTATGSISPVTTVQVGSQVSGIIAKLYADFNSPVRRDQLLAELDPTPFEAQVEQRRADLVQAEVQMRNAELTYRRQERLLDEGLAAQADADIAQANFEAGRAQVDQARAGLRQAEANLKYTKIRSPIDGVVVARQYDVGQTVAASFQAPTLFTIAQDLTRMQVQADVDQSDIGRIKLGQPARFTVDAYPEREFEGQISQIRLNATVNQNVITYPVILSVSNPEEMLRPQMTADVSIEVDRVRDVLRVPSAALRFRPPEGQGVAARAVTGPPAAAAGDGAVERGGRGRPAGGGEGGRRRTEQTVYKLVEEDRLEPVAIRPGISDGRFTAVVEGGVAEGDRVAVGLTTSRADRPARPPGGGMRGF